MHPRRRCRQLLAAIIVAFAFVGVRLVDLQVVNPGGYVAEGRAQRFRSIELPGERGSIFDRNGIELALSVPRKTVWADPRAVPDRRRAARELAPVLDVPESELLRQLRSGGAFRYLARQVEPDVAAAVADLALPGVSVLDESRRFTPAGDLGSSLVGQVDLDGRGLSGLEKQFEDRLLGAAGSLEVERAPDGRTIAGGSRQVTPARRGDDLVLTIDRALQFEVERSLSAAMASNGAERASAIVMDPTTGEVLAMANLKATPDGPRPSRQNWAVTAAFEPGSVNKVITLAGALEEGVYEPSSVLSVPDRLKVSVHTFSDSERHPTERWTVADILTQSSNVGTIKIAQALGEPKVKQYLRRFGLGRSTGLDFPGETRGIMKEGRWDGTDIGSIPIGQGVAVNGMQMLQVFNTIANGGVWVEPRLVRATVDEEGREQLLPPQRRRRVVSRKTADEMVAMMANVVSVGTGINAQVDGYTVAGKTGTARKPDTVNGGYEPGAYISSFAGVVPAQRPGLSAIVIMDEPRPVYYAGLVAAPVYAEIAKYALRRLAISPATSEPSASDLVPIPEPVEVSTRD